MLIKMRISLAIPLFSYFTMIVITLLRTTSRGILANPQPQRQERYYNAHSYQYPAQSAYPQYQQNANGYYYQSPPPRPARYNAPSPVKKERSYKDICRMVNTNGFTNPGGVPKCPY